VNDPRSARASSTPANSTPAGSSEGLDIGYRYLLAHDETPLFPFGFGLSYTTFALSDPRLATSELSSASSGEQLSVLVHNTGQRRGTEVVEAYLAYPSSADEPPEQLRAFNSVTLAPGASARVVLDIPRSSFEAYLGGRFVVPSGTFTLSIGTSSTDLPISFSISVPETGTFQLTS